MSTQFPVQKDRNENIQKMFIEMQRDKQITSKDDEKCCCPEATIKPQHNNSGDSNYQNCKHEPDKIRNQGSQSLTNYIN